MAPPTKKDDASDNLENQVDRDVIQNQGATDAAPTSENADQPAAADAAPTPLNNPVTQGPPAHVSMSSAVRLLPPVMMMMIC